MIQLPKKSAFILFGLASLCIMLPGCVRRRMTVRTNPAGAMVYVDRQPIGKTPASHSFTYYGTRHFEIVKDGYRTEEFLRTFNPPWYQIPPSIFSAKHFGRLNSGMRGSSMFKWSPKQTYPPMLC